MVFHYNVQWIEKDESPHPTPKMELHVRNVMLCVAWGHRGIIHCEFLNCKHTLKTDLYSQQQQRVHENLRKRTIGRNVMLQLARPHSARITQEKIRDLGWIILPNSPYSADLTLRDFHLFVPCKMLWMRKIFFRSSGWGKFLQFKTSWILLERNQQSIW